MSKIWFISDIHFFHYNIIKYTNRPFQTVKEMHEVIITNWNNSIKPDDKVFFVGDFTFGDFHKSQEILKSLNGYKILIRGNHDKAPDKMKQMGFDEVYEHYILELEGYRIFLNHYPYRPKNPENLKQLKKRPEDKGHWLIHGHVHQHWKQKGRMINVSVEVWNYFPASSQDIINLIKNGENNIPETEESDSNY